MAWRVQKECLKKPALRLEDGDSDHRLKPTGTRSGCQSHRDKSFPYHPGLVAPGILVARGATASFPRFLPDPWALPRLELPGRQPRSGCPNLPSPLPAWGPSCAPTSEKAAPFPPSFPFPARGGRLGSHPGAEAERQRPPAASSRGGAGRPPGTPAPRPPGAAPHSPRRARRAASGTWG